MQNIFLLIHVLVAISLIVIVLLQHGKGADAGAAFGSGASSTMFGSRGAASFLTRTTAVLATVFFLSSLGLAYLSMQAREASSVVERVAPEPAPVEGPSDLPEVDGAGEGPGSRPLDVPAAPAGG